MPNHIDELGSEGQCGEACECAVAFCRLWRNAQRIAMRTKLEAVGYLLRKDEKERGSE